MATDKLNALKMIAATAAKHLQAIERLTLSQWLRLANELGVEQNDRNHAAKILALRELRATGKLA